jgi:hypothetical protein
MALELLIGTISTRENGGAEDNSCDGGAHKDKNQGENLAQQDVPPVLETASEILQGRGRNPATEIVGVICRRRLPACQAAHGRVTGRTVETLAGEFPQEFLLVHVILEGFSAVDEDNGHFVVKLPAEFDVGIDVNFAPREAAPPRKLGEAFLHHLAKMAPFSGVHNDVTRLQHVGRILAREVEVFHKEIWLKLRITLK